MLRLVLAGRLVIRERHAIALGEHKPGRIKPGRIKRAALSLQNQTYYVFCFLIRPRLYASDSPRSHPASSGQASAAHR